MQIEERKMQIVYHPMALRRYEDICNRNVEIFISFVDWDSYSIQLFEFTLLFLDFYFFFVTSVLR